MDHNDDMAWYSPKRSREVPGMEEEMGSATDKQHRLALFETTLCGQQR